MMKKFFAMILAACFMVGMIPTAAASDSNEPVAYIEANGRVTYYESLEQAVEAVCDGQTITVMADVEGTVSVSRDVAFILDAGPYQCEIQAEQGFSLIVKGNLYIVMQVPTVLPELYQIQIEPSEHGSVTSSLSAAQAESIVLLKAEPDEKYFLNEISVTDSVGKEITAVCFAENQYFFRMPASDITVTSTFCRKPAFQVVCPRDDTCPAAKFQDINLNNWYHDGIHYAVENHLMVGTGTNTFEPGTATNRAMLVTVLFRFEGEQAVGKCPFLDVPEDRWYTDAITWAAANRIVEGYGHGVFGPEDPITREQMAKILMNYAFYKGYDVSARGDLSDFDDGDDTSHWARQAVEWAVGAQLIQGKGNNCLDPNGNILRAEFATIMMRFCENIAK